MGLEIREIQSLGEFRGAEGNWNRILPTSGEDDIFTRMDWLTAWWEVFGSKREMVLLEILEGKKVVGFAPLMISLVGRIPPWRKLEFIASGPSDRSAVLAENGREDVHRAVWEYVASLGGWDEIEVREMRRGSPTATNAMSAFPNARRAEEVSPFIPMAGSYEKYLESLPRKNRRGLMRCWKRIIEKHDIAYMATRGQKEVRDMFRSFVHLSRARWGQLGKENVLDIPGMSEFVEKSLSALSEKGYVVFHSLEEQDRPIAMILSFEYGRRQMCYLSGFDPEFSVFSPGSLLLSKVLETSHARGLTEVDMLRGGEAYKYRFGAVDRFQIHLSVSRQGGIKSAFRSIREKSRR